MKISNMASPARFCEHCGRTLTMTSRTTVPLSRRTSIQTRTLTTATSRPTATFHTTHASLSPVFLRSTRPPVPLTRATHPLTPLQALSRTFTTTSSRAATAIQNPRTDENGAEMTLEITPRAASRLSNIMAADSNPQLALRITVESGGCHGFQYLMSLTDLKDGERNDEAEDTVFEGAEGAKVVMDEASLEIMKGSVVDYTMELIGSQFKIVNPHATSSCGCGTSFDIKMD